MRVEGQGENKTFTVHVQDQGGQIKDAKYSVYKDSRGILRVAAPGAGVDDRRWK